MSKEKIDSTDWLIRDIPKEQLEVEKKASYYIGSILIEADMLKQHLGILNPTVFISRDILEIIKSGICDYVTYSRSDRKTVCGYECKIAFGENVLYVGYDLLKGGRP